MNANTIATAIAALKAYRNTKGRTEYLGVNQDGNQCRQWHPDEAHIATVDAAIDDLEALQADSAAVAVDENGFLPCPFCGSKAEWRNEGIYRWVYCSKNHCYANQRRVVGNATWTWNQRATRDSAAAPMPVILRKVDEE